MWYRPIVGPGGTIQAKHHAAACSNMLLYNYVTVITTVPSHDSGIIIQYIIE